jgi:hypothetical protein
MSIEEAAHRLRAQVFLYVSSNDNLKVEEVGIPTVAQGLEQKRDSGDVQELCGKLGESRVLNCLASSATD